VAKKFEQTASPERNFTLTTAERVQAIVQGAPAWSRRLKRIEDLTAEIIQCHVAGRVRDVKKKLAEMVKLVEAHNAYYPVEANLPYDKPFSPMPVPTLESILASQPKDEELPASLAWTDVDGALSVAFEVVGSAEGGTTQKAIVKLKLDQEAFTFERDGELVRHVPLWNVEEFDAGPLRVITTDTETIELPAPPKLDETIAAELSARLRALRSATTAYRG
jgi:hypothetical protein